MLSHLRRNAPYMAVFAIAAGLYFFARQIDFAAPGGTHRPGFLAKNDSAPGDGDLRL